MTSSKNSSTGNVFNEIVETEILIQLRLQCYETVVISMYRDAIVFMSEAFVCRYVDKTALSTAPSIFRYIFCSYRYFHL